MYKKNQQGCGYLITSNFEKLWFYNDNAIELIQFNFFTLSEQDFKLLYLCLAYENLAKDLPEKLKTESLSQENWHGKPTNIRTDNGTEFIAKAFEDSCLNSGIEHIKIQKGKPIQNGYCERFNRTFREDVLDEQLREKAEDWREDYNHNHPNSGIGNYTPIE